MISLKHVKKQLTSELQFEKSMSLSYKSLYITISSKQKLAFLCSYFLITDNLSTLVATECMNELTCFTVFPSDSVLICRC